MSSDLPAWLPLLRNYDVERSSSAHASWEPIDLREQPLLRPSERPQAAPQPAPQATAAHPHDDPLRAPLQGPFDPLSAPVDPLSAPLDPLSAIAKASQQQNLATAFQSDVSALGASLSAGGGLLGDDAAAAAAADDRAQNGAGGAPRDWWMASWTEMSERILRVYTTNASIPVLAEFLEETGGAASSSSMEPEMHTVKSVKNSLGYRIAEMEEEDAVASGQAKKSSSLYLSQKECISRIEAEVQRLRDAWAKGARVQALKIAIRCAKLLGKTRVPQFYPSMFVLVTRVLSQFGDNVFNRLCQLCECKDPFGPGGEVAPVAKERCRNWFFKTTCIRELSPRLYIDLALINSYRFLGASLYESALTRLMLCARGVGDVLAGMYVRCFLTMRSMDVDRIVLPASRKHAVLGCLSDFFLYFKNHSADNWQRIRAVRKQQLTAGQYIGLFEPAIHWMLQAVGSLHSEDIFITLLDRYQNFCDDSMVLLHLIDSFPPQFVSNAALVLVDFIASATISSRSRGDLFCALSKCIAMSCPDEDALFPLLNGIWKKVAKIHDLQQYLDVGVWFVLYVVQHFGKPQLGILLKDILKHLKKDVTEDVTLDSVQSQLTRICLHMITYHVYDESLSRADRYPIPADARSKSPLSLHDMLSLDYFLPLLDSLDTQHKCIVAKQLLIRFVQDEAQPTNDTVVVRTLLDVASAYHNSFDALSSPQEVRQAAELIIGFVRLVDYGHDYRTMLDALVDFRAAFHNMDDVIVELIQRVAQISFTVSQSSSGSRDSASFVKACIAYCQITAASLRHPITRLKLFLQTAQIALANGLVVQCESLMLCLIEQVSLVPEYYTSAIDAAVQAMESSGASAAGAARGSGMKASLLEDLCQLLLNAASFLVLVPGHPKHGPFFLAQRLLEAIFGYEPFAIPQNRHLQLGLFIHVIGLFSAYFQSKFPYHCATVESNDSLYGQSSKYQAACCNFLNTIVTFVVKNLMSLDTDAGHTRVSAKHQAELCAQFIYVVLAHLQLNASTMSLLLQLMQLLKSSGGLRKADVDRCGRFIADFIDNLMDPTNSAAKTQYRLADGTGQPPNRKHLLKLKAAVETLL